jgi:hypothetical protein
VDVTVVKTTISDPKTTIRPTTSTHTAEAPLGLDLRIMIRIFLVDLPNFLIIERGVSALAEAVFSLQKPWVPRSVSASRDFED